MGFESPHNTLRYTFDQTWLMSGIPMVPMVIGLFAMSQAFVFLKPKSHPKCRKIGVAQDGLSGCSKFFVIVQR